jgi:hypothetical protein
MSMLSDGSALQLISYAAVCVGELQYALFASGPHPYRRMRPNTFI